MYRTVYSYITSYVQRGDLRESALPALVPAAQPAAAGAREAAFAQPESEHTVGARRLAATGAGDRRRAGRRGPRDHRKRVHPSERSCRPDRQRATCSLDLTYTYCTIGALLC